MASHGNETALADLGLPGVAMGESKQAQLASLYDVLRSGGTYATGAVGRRALWPTGLYYHGMLGTIIGACIRARTGRYRWTTFAEDSWHILKGVERVGGRIEVTGFRTIEGLRGPVVFVANHMSLLETVALPCLLLAAGEMTYVLKRSLLEAPVFGWLMSWMDAIAVGREAARADLGIVMREGVNRLTAGRSVVIFPQSTRRPYLDEKEFNSMGVRLADKAGVPVVPIAIRTDFVEKGWPVKDLGRVRPELPVRFAIGDAIDVGGDRRGAHERVLAFIGGTLRSWGVTPPGG